MRSSRALREYIDWTFFFPAWELKGRFPKILDDPEKGEAARELYEHANELLDEIAAGGLLRPRAASTGSGGPRPRVTTSCSTTGRGFCMLRQQADHGDERRIAPSRTTSRPERTDRSLGAFAVTRAGADELVARFEAENDDYRAIMVKALADRLAEAFAELPARARAPRVVRGRGRLRSDELIAERYRGIRPAFGYPACPDHSEKGKLFDLLGARELGIELTETFAMSPAASVSGLYLAPPGCALLLVGRIGRDQVEDYATRKGQELRETERWLSPNLSYDPT